MTSAYAANARPERFLNEDDLLRAGRSLKVLAIVVIVLLSIGVAVLAFQQWVQTGFLNQLLSNDNQAIYGFGLLMLLTVGYLIGKGWTTSRDQRTMITQLLQEEAISRALHLDPILEFHHPELAREILMREVNYAARIQSPISLVELTVPEFSKLAMGENTRRFAGEFYSEIRRHCRPLDFWLRWSPNSFLLVLLEISPEETAGVVYRLRSRLESWWNQQDDVATPSRLEWRYRSTGSLGSSGDILREVRSLMEPDLFVPTPMADVWQAKSDLATDTSAQNTKGTASR